MVWAPWNTAPFLIPGIKINVQGNRYCRLKKRLLYREVLHVFHLITETISSWWRKSENTEKTTDFSQDTDTH